MIEIGSDSLQLVGVKIDIITLFLILGQKFSNFIYTL